MIEIIKEKEQWDSLMKLLDSFDFYHTFEYHQISKKQNEEPILFKYSENDKVIAIPLLLRKIPNSNYMDCTSVYGYVGPLTKNIDENFNNSDFATTFQDYLIHQNIVTIFSRLNPFISHQPLCLNGLGEISSLSQIVNIDISQTLENQKKVYNKRLRTHINKARRECSIKQAETNEEILQYIDLYYANMKRVEAKKEYFFSYEYFIQLLNAKSFNTRILLASEKETQKIIAGAMFVETNKILQYHLSGSDADFLNLYPVKLLIDEMRVLATEENLNYFNLGGGVGNKKDSLFDFKSGYSKDFKPFRVWRYIVNEQVYNTLVSENLEKVNTPCNKENTYFFPSYRSNN